MDQSLPITVLSLSISAALAAWLAPKARRRLQLSRAKHRSLTGHSRMAKRLASWLPGYCLKEDAFFGADGADAALQLQRRQALQRLSAHFSETVPRGSAMTQEAKAFLADLDFTGRYRVPFQFTEAIGQALSTSSFVIRTQGSVIEDVDGNAYLDVSGSYGVNVLGYDVYKACIEEAVLRAGELGPVLGAYHPVVLENAQRLARISGLDQVSFHMSGTEAVMQAVRLARYHTGKRHLVRFCGAYHGWWEDVQPGPGNPLPPRETFTLQDMSARSLNVLRSHGDIACVLINPLQALHPNSSAPGDSSLVDSTRRASYDRAGYTQWLQQVREVCTERGIVLIFDEVFLGFRLAAGGAQEYFGVKADMVTYGKTLGGGLPVGVVCGRGDLMRRYRTKRPADICFARGTFNSHPYVMSAMKAFLDRLEQPATRSLYEGLEDTWNRRCKGLNQRLQAAGLPVRTANMSTVWTFLYERPSRFNWLYQFYLRKHGLWLSWVGSGRMIFSLDYSDADYAAVADRIVAAAQEMQADGWWSGPELSNKDIKRRVLKEMFAR
ncbi:MAG: aminotransferase class III-fold pyridoxal phosphate-dependent enzyme [Betaproteobacteria bacterium]|nr:aminotransferase class III-fold pyridoxal phosphate-dependent enzyme [Betaproteobacteria bacterium]NBX97120.1 aminotransferase class III-fold pyridoxal phosphate-dependent enzyme [Betaproteobacteria bacterium]